MSNFSMPTFGLAPAWFNSMIQASTKAMTIAFAAQQVIGLRLTMLAANGNTSTNRREVERMVTEKMDAVNESGRVLFELAGSMAQAVPTMFFDPKAAERMLNRAAKAGDRALTPFERRVTANKKRLSR
ncbi:MAG: hypothetical protein Q4G46_05515 [Propionibacteriaceae bacterium]|nr:hypothetical protein [Propionibacteriaceae bacterium]